MVTESPKFHQLTALERRATLGLASIVSLRMLGLFMIFPVLSLYIGVMPGATAITMGIAFGIYGLTQGLLQIPFGMLSDRFGRKPIILIGLSLFVIGSVIAALSNHALTLIIGRCIQGAGAVAGAVMALTADLTREETRTKALALIGMTIGMAVMVALIIGPGLNQWIGLSGIFWLTASFAIVAIMVLLFIVPDPQNSHFHRDAEPVPEQIMRVVRDSHLLRFNIGILILHAVFAACFLVFPIIIKDYFKLPSAHSWWVYVPTMALSLLIMLPMIIVGEKYRRMKQMFLIAITLITVVEFVFFMAYTNKIMMLVLMVLFFGGFNFLEAALPSLVSKTAPADSKGTAMGVYSTAQYFGTFIGGATGGYVLHYFGIEGIFLFCMALGMVWIMVAINMEPPRYLNTQLLNVGVMDDKQAQHMVMQLTGVRGVAEAVVRGSEGIAYLKVDSKALDREHLYSFSKSDT